MSTIGRDSPEQMTFEKDPTIRVNGAGQHPLESIPMTLETTTTPIDAGDPPLRCQATPAAARRGFREDVLCASLANTTVPYQDGEMAVCRMHEATYTRWGENAEANASELWKWPAVLGEPQPVESS
jgi:hypothetical protein